MPGFTSKMQRPPSAILFQSADGDVTLIDIPTSIATAQFRSDVLLSTAPLETPYDLQEEPKTAQAKKNHSSQLTDLHIEYKSAIHAALAEIRSHVSGPWCTPRRTMAQGLSPGENSMQDDEPDAEKNIESRLREWSALGVTESKGEDARFDFEKMMASLGATGDDPIATPPAAVTHRWRVSYGTPRELHSDTHVQRSEAQDAAELWTSSLHNPEAHPLDIHVHADEVESEDEVTRPGGDGQACSYHFTVPPRATFFLRDSTHSDSFRASFRALTDEYGLRRRFDLVLLDPPWPNRSAKRKGAYEQVGGMPHMKRMLLKMDIDNYLERGALVGVWITNKAAMRGHVLGPGGLFEKWNVGLVEEWVWVKVTTHGEPMFDIDSALRRPYEILLLGRAAPNAWTRMAHARPSKKKVIVAVPDVHSRKPCLKELLEPYMPDTKDYSALEVFSRNLVAGWTSWGNEVIKYNWEKYWVPFPASP